MIITNTFLNIFETLIISSSLGFSTMAVVYYAIHSKYGYPKEGIGSIMTHALYKALRVCFVILGIIFLYNFFVYGILDSNAIVFNAYAVKLFLISINILLAICMTRKILKVRKVAPIVASFWYFLSSFHAYTLIADMNAYVGPTTLLLALIYIAVFYGVFYLIDKKLK